MENLLFAWLDIRVETVTVSDELNTLALASTRSEAACLLCQEISRTIHSQYERSLGDLPCCGKALRLRLQVRRFFCRQAACPRRVFAERRSDIMQPSARRTIRLNETLQTLGLALGRDAGERTARQLRLPVSAATLLRRVRALPKPPASSVRVVSIDDFALRRGHRYGTILVDEERREPIDLLPDREAATVQQWLEEHPEIEIITRDRAVVYANAARDGAPQATQVADRFHLLQNLTEAETANHLTKGAELARLHPTRTAPDRLVVTQRKRAIDTGTTGFLFRTQSSQPGYHASTKAGAGISVVIANT